MQAKVTQIINHRPLLEFFQSADPKFVPTNGCLSDQKNKALSLCLLAAFKAVENVDNKSLFNMNSDSSAMLVSSNDLNIFTTGIIKELKNMGIKNPINNIKEGGVGQDNIDYVSERFLFSVRNGGQCPATISIIGALAAQETIKAITNVHIPIDQFLMFESLDSILLPLPSSTFPPSSTTFSSPPSDLLANSSTSTSTSTTESTVTATASVYGDEIAAELARMKIFIVGSGAIGCELLKTFALLGVGIGIGEEVSQEEENESNKGLWEGLSTGGIVLADMDQIERSNLNRQLLFREKHVGQAKAVVAAETVQQVINVMLYYIR